MLNVVKAPIRPVNRKSATPGGSDARCENAHSAPMRKHPIMLAASVPQGKAGGMKRWTRTETTCRRRAPIAPPAAIRRRERTKAGIRSGDVRGWTERRRFNANGSVVQRLPHPEYAPRGCFEIGLYWTAARVAPSTRRDFASCAYAMIMASERSTPVGASRTTDASFVRGCDAKARTTLTLECAF